ncbi:hypothetical protein [Haloarcula sp. 1CSR25-25]|uniref:hypothetical protein n=1 Tax=Haloarcula sp. 1CSR25-25 TaxID=2862545 RepID=UPI0028950B56|nr:hypothetical protein [Haloarcula sp. 1CSR25-25]MDT3434271.1 hypothetical protein [Haloarcula sp. 1CSR25-25]
MSKNPLANLDSITIPSREAIKDAYEQNQFQGDQIRVAMDEYVGDQRARVKHPHEHLEMSLSPREFIEHIDGETWPTKHDAESVVFTIDRYPEITYEREEELENSEELESAVAEVWEELKEYWWNDTKFLTELESPDGHSVSVHYEEDEET